ncbi:uncharacterized protein BJX67DRAFT_379106 [Aspergillus lucknowensis]|uniref:NACHT domain-containing protein n=1 Tax=Aspergillus lucknowensis TaxID=176173 RepID=A0ABR4LYF3_9EURO
MEALEAIGLASNIITFINFSYELVTGAWDVYKSGAGATSQNAALGTIVADLEDVSRGLQQQSSVKRCLDSLQIEAERLYNENVKKLELLRTEVQEGLEQLRDMHGKSEWKQPAGNGESAWSVPSTVVRTAMTRLQGLAVGILSQNEILARLHYPSMYRREDSVVPAEAQTFRWIVDDSPPSKITDELWYKKSETRKSFLEWLRTGSGIFHISGKAGSGKSTLMKLLCNSAHVQTELQKWAGSQTFVFAKFFFWIAGNEMQRSLEGLYRSILFEVLRKYPELTTEIFPGSKVPVKALGAGVPPPEFRLDEIKDGFMRLIKLPTTSNHRICLFIDGLDEYEGDSVDHWEIASNMITWTKTANVKICVSSRPYTEFMESFNFHPEHQVRLHELTEADIRAYCYATMQKDRNFDRIKGSYLDLTQAIVSRARGVFLWVRLATRIFLSSVGYRDSPETLLKKLASVPDDMRALFDGMLGAVDSSNRERADKLLLLTLESLTSVPAILYLWFDDLDDPNFPFQASPPECLNPGVQRIEAVIGKIDALTKGLLEVVTDGSGYNDFSYSVQFFHRSVLDYVHESLAAQIKQRQPDFDVQESFCRLVLAYFKLGRGQTEYPINAPKLWYLLYQFFHQLAPSTRSQAIFQGFYELWNKLSMLSQIRIHRGKTGVFMQRQRVRHQLDYLCWLLCFGYGHYVQDKVLTDSSFLQKPNLLKRLFLLSAVEGHTELVRLLLRKGKSPTEKIVLVEGKSQCRYEVSIWMLILTACVEQLLNPRSRYRSAEIIQELLTWDPLLDHEMYFVVLLVRAVGSPPVQKENLRLVTLQEVLDMRDTPESQELRQLVSHRKNAPKDDTRWSDDLKAKYKGLTESPPKHGPIYEYEILSTHTRSEEFNATIELELEIQ